MDARAKEKAATSREGPEAPRDGRAGCPLMRQLTAQHADHLSGAKRVSDRAVVRQLSPAWERRPQGMMSLKFWIQPREGLVPKMEGTGLGVGSRDGGPRQ